MAKAVAERIGRTAGADAGALSMRLRELEGRVELPVLAALPVDFGLELD
jgi:hypothetical protein